MERERGFEGMAAGRVDEALEAAIRARYGVGVRDVIRKLSILAELPDGSDLTLCTASVDHTPDGPVVTADFDGAGEQRFRGLILSPEMRRAWLFALSTAAALAAALGQLT